MNVEDRLRQLPQMAEELDLEATEALKRKIMQRIQEYEEKRARRRRMIPAICCAAAAVVFLVGGVFAIPALRAPAGPAPTDAPLMTAIAAGDSLPLGEKLALDLPQGSITISNSANPSYRSIWAGQNGGNFPLIGVEGRYYRLLTNPTAISSEFLGSALGTVDQYTSEPALAGRSSICSNVVQAGETVYAVRGMNGALAAANVDGVLRVFQRVSFGDSALVGGESLADTLQAGSVAALELSGVGAVKDATEAKRLIDILLENAVYQKASAGESNQSLLIQMSSGLTLQMAVSGEKLMACGTWVCPEFFDAFQEALQ